MAVHALSVPSNREERIANTRVLVASPPDAIRVAMPLARQR